MSSQHSRVAWTCWLLLANCLLGLLCPQATRAQAVKGGSGSLSSSLISQQLPVANANNQFSSSFVEMFNQLTPVQQQQFIRQMSSSNRRIFQQALQPQQANYAFSEELSSNQAGGLAGAGGLGGALGATKSAAFRQSSSSVLSPVQQALFRSQQSKSFSSSASQPTLAPSSQFSFSRQISQSNQQPYQLQPQTNEANFQSSKTIVNSALQPQQQSYFNRVQSVQQVAQPVLLPSTEQSFRRVQKFSSQPLALPVDSSSSSFTQQQFVQQQQQPVQQLSSSFNRFQQQSQQQPLLSGFNQFSSSSSSNLAGNGAIGSFLSADGLANSAGFAGANLQQEKVELDGSQLGTTAGGSLLQQNQQSNLLLPAGQSSFEQSSSSNSGFDSGDAQQKNLQVPDDFYGLTAASINNKWYIMKPVENLQQMPLGRALINNQLRLASADSLRSAKLSVSSATSGSSTAATSAGSTSAPTPKKRSAGETSSKKKKAAAGASSSSAADEPAGADKPPVSTSSSLMEPEEANDDEERKR